MVTRHNTLVKASLSFAASLGVVLCMTQVANAATIVDSSNQNAYVDFTTDGAPDGAATWGQEVAGVLVTVTPEPQPDARLYWDSEDGFGVRYSYETDEIEGPESLVVSFSEEVFLQEVDLSDLFYEYRDGAWYNEIGYYAIDGGPCQEFQATNNHPNGEQALLINTNATTITFQAPGRLTADGHDQDHDYSIRGLSFSVGGGVPEIDGNSLGALGLLLFGVSMVLYDRRRYAMGRS